MDTMSQEILERVFENAVEETHTRVQDVSFDETKLIIKRTLLTNIQLNQVHHLPLKPDPLLMQLNSKMHSHILDFSGLTISPQNLEIVLKLYNLIEE